MELAVVVVIVGILAMLAVVSYRKLIGSSHVAEATHMVQAIRVAQEAYHAETQQYANVSTDINSTYPAPGSGGQPVPGRFKTGWGAACTNCNSGIQWTDLPVHVDGPVMFGYATVSGPAGATPVPGSASINGVTVSFPAKSPTDYFVIRAKGDTDGNGAFCNVYGTSWTNDLFVDQDGE